MRSVFIFFVNALFFLFLFFLFVYVSVNTNPRFYSNLEIFSSCMSFFIYWQGANSTTKALSKLTNRLNFLKERRTQIASELQNIHIGWSPVQAAQTPGRGRGGTEPRLLGLYMNNNNNTSSSSQLSQGQSSERNEGGADGNLHSLPSSEYQSDNNGRTGSQSNLDRGNESRSKGANNPRTQPRWDRLLQTRRQHSPNQNLLGYDVQTNLCQSLIWKMVNYVKWWRAGFLENHI